MTLMTRSIESSPAGLVSKKARPNMAGRNGQGVLGVIALMGGAPLWAQSAPPASVAASELGLEEISVTASRIQRTGFEAPTPITMIGDDEIKARAATRINQILFEMPALRPTATFAPSAERAGGVYANLRSLNPGSPVLTATRTLVLVDGRRIVPNTVTGLVDLNAIPTSLVERVEVVTGGASAAWGSDAVAGVTNFILKRRIDGLESTVQYGQSQHGDQKEQSVSLGWGTSYGGGRGELMVAGEYSKLYDNAYTGDRDWGNRRYGWVAGAIDGRNVTRIALPGVTTSQVTYGGVITNINGTPLPVSHPLRGIQFGPGGAPQAFTYGRYLTNTLMVGGSGTNLSHLIALSAPLTRNNVYGRTTFDLTDTTQLFFEASYADTEVAVNLQPNFLPNGDSVLTIQRDNAFLPTSIRTLMTSSNPQIAAFGLGRVNPEFGVYQRGESRAKARRVAAGISGALVGSWTYQVHAGAGKTDYFDRNLNNVRQSNLRAAVDSVIGPTGTPICRINSTIASDIAIVSAANYQGRGADPGCVPANPFGPGSLTPAVADYVLGTSFAIADIEQQSAGASLQGEPFSSWAGPVSVAAGLEYRKESVAQFTDSTTLLSTPAFQTGGWQLANRRPLNGSYNVKEAFAETVVPLLAERPFAEALDFNAAVRGTDYSTSGVVTSWKAGLTYTPIDGLLFRATRSKDIRAPNLTELYTPGISIIVPIVDYGRPGNPSPSAAVTTIGNSELEPETADTDTIGVTWQPSGIPGLRTSVDFYRINLKDAIGSFGGQNIVNACYGVAPFSAPVTSACGLISRDSNGVITSVANASLNLAFTNTQGIDTEVSYRIGQGERNWTLRLLATHLDSLDINSGIVTIDRAGEIGNSKWRLNGSVTYNSGPFTAFLQGLWLEKGKIDNTYTRNDIYDNNVPSFFYMNGSAQYSFEIGDHLSDLQVFFSVNNILDRDPPIIPAAASHAGQVSTLPDYDKIGRYFTAGVRLRF